MFAAEQVFLGDHFQNRPHILRHAAMDENETVLQLLTSLLCDFFGREDVMLRHQTTTTNSELRIISTSHTTLNQFDARPDSAGILPAAAGSANPFPQNRSRRHDAAIRFFQLSC